MKLSELEFACISRRPVVHTDWRGTKIRYKRISALIIEFDGSGKAKLSAQVEAPETRSRAIVDYKNLSIYVPESKNISELDYITDPFKMEFNDEV